MAASNNSDFLTIKDFAAELGVDPSTVSRWCGLGLIKSLKLGTSQQSLRRISRSELSRVLNGGLGQVAK